jgi:hypothetical protein
MAALEELHLNNNSLTGTVPAAWGSCDRLRRVWLLANPQLSGCLPAAWRSKVNVDVAVGEDGPVYLTRGTNITGFC